MEIILGRASEKVSVICDGQFSHEFILSSIFPEHDDGAISLKNPVETGKCLFDALFRAETPARIAFDAKPKRILLVADATELDAVPWEYLYGPNGFIILDVLFVRGLPSDERQAVPDLHSTPLHVVAVPSNPIAHDIVPLDIEGEWQRLKENIQEVTSAMMLERVRPPTLEQTRSLVADKRHLILHFMGHGGSHETNAVLIFEDQYGGPRGVTAIDFVRRMEDTTFLVTLNACVSATPGETEFSNLARALVERGVPYALGMRFSIPDDDAKVFSGVFYDELSRGTSVENALRHVRNQLAESKNPWAIGTPVLYSSLAELATGFGMLPGRPRVEDHEVPMDVAYALPKAAGAFQGRIDELLALGQMLTSDPRSRLISITGSGGQGKTALAREAVDRFSHAWPGGVFALSLEHLPSRAEFCTRLGKFLALPTDQLPLPEALERLILQRLTQQRTLLVLDNAETFTEAVRAKNPDALDLADFLRDRLPGTLTGLLVTSREPLGWPGELVLPLEGLSLSEGAALFRQSAPQRINEIALQEAEALSRRVDGHPLALRLLGLAFNEIVLSLADFLAEHEQYLLQAEDRYKAEDHRHRTLYASIETSVRYLQERHKQLLSGLWIFRSPFLPEIAGEIFAALEPGKADELEQRREAIASDLLALSRRGLLVREVETLEAGNLLLYRCLPTVRLFAQHYLEQVYPLPNLRAQMGHACYRLLQSVFQNLDKSAWASYLVMHSRGDFEGCAPWVEGETDRGRYENRLGWVLQRTGDRQAGLRHLEQALELAQGRDEKLELDILNNMALVYQDIGQSEKALELNEQVLPIRREVDDRSGEATTLNNMASAYQATGQPAKALELLEQALSIRREVDDRAGVAATLNNMGEAYRATGEPGKALELYEQALPIIRAAGDRAGEAITMNNMALVYHATGQPDKALELFEQALPIQREVDDRAGVATTLSNMAEAYRDLGQPMKALELFEQALPIQREVDNRAGEAITLNNMALAYQDTDQLEKALELNEQVLPIRREVGDRAGEATTLNNLASVYHDMGQLEKALELYEQTLPIQGEVEDRAGEAATLNNMGNLYQDTGQPDKALERYEQALPIRREVGDRRGEATTCFNLAMLCRKMEQEARALEFLRQAVLLEKQVRHHDYAQHATLLATWEDLARLGQPLPKAPSGTPGLSSEQVQTIVHNTIAVLTYVPEQLADWRGTLSQVLQQAQAASLQPDQQFLEAVLAILDGKTTALPEGNPFSEAVQSILQGVAVAQSPELKAIQAFLEAHDASDLRQVIETHRSVLLDAKMLETLQSMAERARGDHQLQAAEFCAARAALLKACMDQGIDAAFSLAAQPAEAGGDPARTLPEGMPADFVSRCASGLKGTAQEKNALLIYLSEVGRKSDDAGLAGLIKILKLALFGQEPAVLGKDLGEPYTTVWEQILERLM